MMRPERELDECSDCSSNVTGPPDHLWARHKGHSGLHHEDPSRPCHEMQSGSCHQPQNDLSGPVSRDDNISLIDGSGNGASNGYGDQPQNDLSRPNRGRSNRQSKRGSLLERIEEQLKEFQSYMLQNMYSEQKEVKSKMPLKPSFSTTLRRRNSEVSNINNMSVGSQDSIDDSNHNEDIYCVQTGEGNLTVVCEPKGKPRSKVCCKQIGNNNTIVNLAITVSSNSFQVQDIQNGVIPLDTDGEVWLEIKRKRKRTASENSDANLYATVKKPQNTSGHGTRHKIPTEHYDMDQYATVDKSRRGSSKPPVGCPGNLVEDIWSSVGTDQPSSDICSRVPLSTYRHGRIAARCPDEHSESSSSYHDCMESVYYNPVYDTIKVFDDVLSVKLPSTSGLSLSQFQDLESIPYMDEVLSEKRVMDFLMDEGNEFDVQVCEWEYETESVYVNEPVRDPRSHDYSGYASIGDPEQDASQCVGPPRGPVPPPRPKPLQQPDSLTPSKEQASPPSAVGKRRLPQPPKQTPLLLSPDESHSDTPTIPPRLPPSPSVPRRLPPNPTESEVPKPTLTIPERSSGDSTSRTPTSPIPPPPSYKPNKPHAQPRAAAKTTDGPIGTKVAMPSPPAVVIPDRQRTGQYPVTPPTPMENGSQLRELSIQPPLIPPRLSQCTDGDSLCSCSWYQENADRDKAIALLTGKPGGCFLVRRSTGSAHDYTIQFVDDRSGRVKRLRILKTDGKYHIEESDNQVPIQKFDKLVDLIEAMIKTGLEIHEKEEWRTIQVTPFRM